MDALVKWRGVAAAGSVAALFAGVVALAPGAASAGSLHSCPNKTVPIEISNGYGGTTKYKEHIKSISSQGVSCAAADKFIEKDLTSATGKVEGYKCKVTTTFKVPVGYVPTVCTRSGSKIQFARHGG